MASHQQHAKVRVVIECTLDERARIKMLAASKHMTISEYFLYMAKKEMSGKSKKTPNKDTLAAMKEVNEGGGHSFESLEDFWEQMGINPDA